MDSLEKDVTACLRFLIAHQEEWEPNMDIHAGDGQTRRVPVTLIGDEREREGK